MQRNNSPQRSKEEKQEKKLLAETELPLHKRERKIVWQHSNLLFSQAVSGTAVTGAHPTH